MINEEDEARVRQSSTASPRVRNSRWFGDLEDEGLRHVGEDDHPERGLAVPLLQLSHHDSVLAADDTHATGASRAVRERGRHRRGPACRRVAEQVRQGGQVGGVTVPDGNEEDAPVPVDGDDLVGRGSIRDRGVEVEDGQ